MEPLVTATINHRTLSVLKAVTMCGPILQNNLGLLVFLLPLTIVTVPALGVADGQEVGSKVNETKGRLGGYKILPVPIIITEPAIGEGLGVAIALFHPIKAGSGSVPRATTPTSIGQMDNDRSAPPVATGVFGAYTNSGTWAAGIGHTNNWREDRIRYTAALVATEINSEVYVLGRPLKYTLEGGLIYQDAKFRLSDSNYFLGMSFSYLDAKSTFGAGSHDARSSQLFRKDSKNVGLAVRGSYDSRDNTTNPYKGQLVDLSLWRYDDVVGGDHNYWSTKLKALSFHHFHNKFTLGLRLDVSAVDGQPPFYGYPWVNLRGIPAMRYQDERAGAIEMEGRYQLAQKWEVLGFTGLGFTDGDNRIYDNPSDIYNVGMGARYKLLEQHNLWVGLDVARGPEEWNWYIQVGHSW